MREQMRKKKEREKREKKRKKERKKERGRGELDGCLYVLDNGGEVGSVRKKKCKVPE